MTIPKGRKMNIFACLAVGLIAGGLAGQLVRGGDLGRLGDIIIGVVGAGLGVVLVAAIFGGDFIASTNATSVLIASLGAVILIAIMRMLPLNSRT